MSPKTVTTFPSSWPSIIWLTEPPNQAVRSHPAGSFKNCTWTRTRNGIVRIMSTCAPPPRLGEVKWLYHHRRRQWSPIHKHHMDVPVCQSVCPTVCLPVCLLNSAPSSLWLCILWLDAFPVRVFSLLHRSNRARVGTRTNTTCVACGCRQFSVVYRCFFFVFNFPGLACARLALIPEPQNPELGIMTTKCREKNC